MSETEDFAAMLDEQGVVDRVNLEVGDKVRAVVVHIAGENVFCAVSGSQEGWLPAEEVTENGQLTVFPGDHVEAYVVELGDSIKLARRLGRGGFDLVALESARRGGAPISGSVTGVNKGGLEVSVAGTRGFCPIGQADVDFVDDPQQFIGQTLDFLVTEIKEDGRNVILNRRKLLQRERDIEAAKTLETLEVGQRCTGKVTRVVDFGAFVDLGGLDGLIPMAELAYHRVDKATDVVSVGEQVEVEIKKIEDDPKRPDKKRIGLSLKATAVDPFDEFISIGPEGRSFDGEVTKVADFGAFIKLSDGVEGLAHISQLSIGRIGHPNEVVKVGDKVTATVIKIEPEKRRIGLSLRDDATADPQARGATDSSGANRGDKPKVGDSITGTVTRIENYGVFVKFGGGHSALLPAAESGTPRGTDMRKTFPMGSEVEAEVVNIDERGRIKVSKRSKEQREERQRFESYKGSGSLGTLGDLLAAKKRN